MMFPSSHGRTRRPGQDIVGEFGEKFRKAREKKEISLQDVSNVTKISARMLRAIEEEHFEALPGGVFNKGFIRTYAKHLGLNDEEAVASYLVCIQQAQVDALQASTITATAGTGKGHASPEKLRLADAGSSYARSNSSIQTEEPSSLRPPRAEHVRSRRKNFALMSDREIPWGLLSVAVVVVILATILWIRHTHRMTTPAANRSSAPSPAPASANQPSRPATGSTRASVTTRPAPNRQAGQGPTPTSSTEISTILPAGAATPVMSTPTSPPLTLGIRATETSWISVQADGETVSQETLIAPARVSVRAHGKIVARVGNAAGISFLWNGREVPADGIEAEVKTFVFDNNGMRVIPSAPSSSGR